MSKKMKNAPIFYTVGQVKFNPVLDMQDFISQLQKEWRSTNPDFTQDSVTDVQIHMPGPDKAAEVKTISSPRWHFKDTEGTSGYVLKTDSLSFHTTAYQDRDHFVASVLTGLDVVNKHVELAYIEGVGVRTLDAVVPMATDRLDDYLRPGLLGLYEQLGGQLKRSILQLDLDTTDGQLVSKVVLLKGRIGMPAELMPLQLTLGERVSAIDGTHVVLDNDCIQKMRFPVSLDEVDKRVRALKSQVSNAFRKAISDHAIKQWS